MSEQKKPPQSTNYFEVDINEIKTSEVLPCDFFLYLQKNEKFIQWIRKGEPLTSDRLEKLQRLGYRTVFAPVSQRDDYVRYVESTLLSTKGPSAASVNKIFGSVIRKENETIFVRGSKSFESTTATTKIAGPAKVNVSVEFINAVIAATQKVFQDRFSNPVKFKSANKRGVSTTGARPIDVASFMVLTSQSIRGTIGLCFPTETYLHVLCQATECGYTELVPELCAGACEFLFHIYEEARPQLYELGYHIDRAVPTLVVGDNMSLAHVIPDNGFSVIFETQGGPFQLEIGIKSGA